MTRALSRGAWLATAVVLVLLPLLPLPAWTGAADTGPGAWMTTLRLWGFGSIVVLGVAYIGSRFGPQLGLAVRLPDIDRRHLVWALALALALAAAFTARVAYAGNPQLIDEAAQLFQARVFASGRVAAPVPQPAAFFLIQLTTITKAGWVAQFPPGGSAVLALGFLLGAPWLVNPLLAACGVWLLYRLAANLYGPRTGLLAAAAWAGSAWVLFMSASYMNHVASTTFALAAWAALLGTRRPGRGHAVLAGMALAAVAATRPLDAVAAAVPLALWALNRRRWPLLPWGVIGALPVLAAMAWLNYRQWGDALTLGYSVLYGKEESLGFHVDPYGNLYTPMVALNNLAMGVRRLHIYLYESPVPVLVLPAAWATVSRHRHPSDAIVVAGLVAAPVLYMLYWHSGFFLGPRFYYGAVPWLAIVLARSVQWLWRLARRPGWRRWNAGWFAWTAAATVVLWSLFSLVPGRFVSYRDSFPTFKRHPEVALARAGISNAIVLVPESWGSRTVADLWALGGQPGLVERAYRHADLCELAGFAERARTGGVTGKALDDTLERFAAETPAPLVRDWPDPTVRLRPNATVPERCRTQLARDQAGFTVYGNLAWLNSIGLNGGVIFSRDFFERNGELLRRYPGWPVFRYAPPPGRPDALPVLSRVVAAPAPESR